MWRSASTCPLSGLALGNQSEHSPCCWESPNTITQTTDRGVRLLTSRSLPKYRSQCWGGCSSPSKGRTLPWQPYYSARHCKIQMPSRVTRASKVKRLGEDPRNCTLCMKKLLTPPGTAGPWPTRDTGSIPVILGNCWNSKNSTTDSTRLNH